MGGVSGDDLFGDMITGLPELPPPDPAVILDNIRSFMRYLRDNHRTILVPGEEEAGAVRAMLDHHHAAGLYSVAVSPFVDPGTVIVVKTSLAADLGEAFPPDWVWAGRDLGKPTDITDYRG